MAAHVVVIDSAARRYNIKTTPTKTLSEVLEDACTKINIDPSQYGLKHNNKPVDLSRTIRLSGLSSGAKLELVQLSKSTGVVSVALQFPESEAQGLPNGRLTDKFPSTTTLWLVLRKFESGTQGNMASRNLTARGAPSTNTGAGRLYYQQPVIQIMGRELASFTDLQKSLAQLGFNSGSTLLRLSFRASSEPLEEAMTQIQGYFNSISAQAPAPPAQQPAPANSPIIAPDQVSTRISDIIMDQKEETTDNIVSTSTAEAESSTSVPSDSLPQSGGRPISVFSPPTASTPAAALSTHNDSDFTPTVEHAQIHQKLLQQSAVNKRLPTDAEIALQAQSEADKWAAVTSVEIKIRFPDQSAVSTKFTPTDSAATLYTFARDCLNEPLRNEPFILRNPGVRGKGEILPDDPSKLLIKHLQLRGRVLVVFGWDDTRASLAARGARQVLRPDLRSQATAPKAPEIPGVNDGAEDDDKGVKVNVGRSDGSGANEGDGKKKLPKWLKGLGGKK